MACMRRDFLIAAALVLIGTCPLAHSQAPGSVGLGAPTLLPPVLSPATTVPDTSWPPPEYRLPPLDESLSRPDPNDPLLAYTALPPPGWFANVEVGVIAPHFKNRMVGSVPMGGGFTLIHVPGASLDWAPAPRFEFGYRLPRGFGEFLLSYQFLSTQGQGDLTTDGGTAHLSSRLAQNIVNVDYANMRVLPNTGFLSGDWLIGGRAGVTMHSVYYDAHTDQLGLDGTLVGQQATNNFVGAGPHALLELRRRLPLPGLAIQGWFEGATLYGRLTQSFTETIVTPGAAALGGTGRLPRQQNVGFLGARVGFSWIPPANNRIRLFVGYQLYQWWQIGRLTTFNPDGSFNESYGSLTEHGIIFRGEFTF